jgi:mRNA interferase RelE/StbE
VAYAVEIKPSATKELAGLTLDVRRRVAAKIDTLAQNPRSPGCEKLRGEENEYRVRVGDSASSMRSTTPSRSS